MYNKLVSIKTIGTILSLYSTAHIDLFLFLEKLVGKIIYPRLNDFFHGNKNRDTMGLD